MKSLKNWLYLVFFLGLFGCTDGMLMGQKIKQLMEANKTETIVIIVPPNAPKSLPAKNVIIDNQVLQAGNEYYNLSKVWSMRVKGKELEVEIH